MHEGISAAQTGSRRKGGGGRVLKYATEQPERTQPVSADAYTFMLLLG